LILNQVKFGIWGTKHILQIIPLKQKKLAGC
jgi:hypothetical protein